MLLLLCHIQTSHCYILCPTKVSQKPLKSQQSYIMTTIIPSYISPSQQYINRNGWSTCCMITWMCVFCITKPKTSFLTSLLLHWWVNEWNCIPHASVHCKVKYNNQIPQRVFVNSSPHSPFHYTTKLLGLLFCSVELIINMCLMKDRPHPS